MGWCRQDRTEQRVVEAEFGGVVEFLRVVAGSADPGEVRAFPAGRECRGREMQTVGPGATRNVGIVIDQHEGTALSRDARDRLGEPQALRGGPALVAYLDQPQALVQCFFQPFELTLDAFDLARGDGHRRR